MDRRGLLTVCAAVAGVAAVMVGIHQDLVHVGAAYDGRIVTGWDGKLNHEEVLLGWLSVVGLVGAVGALRWKRLAAVPVAIGGVVLFYTLRAVLSYARDPGLYREVPTHAGGTRRFVLGAEPFLLVAGGLLLIAAGVVGWRFRGDRTNGPELPDEQSTRV